MGKYQIAIFASGRGSNAQKIIRHFTDNALAGVALVISNKENAGVLQIANKEHIPTLIIGRKELADPGFMLSRLEDFRIDLLVLAGFLLKIPDYLVAHYPNRIINIHPALLPKYGGKGMYGERVHAAVLAAGEQESGITIHYVNDRYDEGRTILQKKCPVTQEDTPESLAQKVHQLEHEWFPVTIEKILMEISKK